ncbi:hypothetical protein HanRHA438_Chr17g0799181 [Helianthus annuus]|nr:hypothetical protein HanIR_Chr17g0856191 [Helianthus annuus]KAJ0825071.1 hypothetical protein HanRHA438_Chr17g0799181 [Helianthus annuus]
MKVQSWLATLPHDPAPCLAPQRRQKGNANTNAGLEWLSQCWLTSPAQTTPPLLVV